MEETGFGVESQCLLGLMTRDTGTQGTIVPVYLGKVGKKGRSNQDYSEAILRNEILTIKEIKDALAKGTIEMNIKDKKVLVGMRDPFLTYAILQAEHQKKL